MGAFLLGFIRAKHFMSLRGIYRGPRGILCTRGEKAHTSKRQTIVACDDCLVKSAVCDAYTGIFQNPPRKTQSHQNSDFLGLGDPKRYFCTFGEKEQASKRVSVIACDNVISKARFATRTRLRKNPSRTPKIHQNSDFLGEHQNTINPAFYGGIYLCHCEELRCNNVRIPRKRTLF